jgi:hypothetical protein
MHSNSPAASVTAQNRPYFRIAYGPLRSALHHPVRRLPLVVSACGFRPSSSPEWLPETLARGRSRQGGGAVKGPETERCRPRDRIVTVADELKRY